MNQRTECTSSLCYSPDIALPPDLELLLLGVCVCVCLAFHSARLLGPPFAEVGIRKSRPPGNSEGPRNYPFAR